MIFTDPTFLFVFLPLACLIFFLVSGRFGATAGLGVIFIASLVFYAPWGVGNLTLLLVSVALNFAAGQLLLALPDTRPRRRMAVLALGELYNFGALIWFKYQFIQSFWLRSDSAEFSAVGLAIPIGISFYTFHQAAFLADAYRRESSVLRYLGGARGWLGQVGAFVRYAAFVTFFPQLVIGPITYLREFQPQVKRADFGRFLQTSMVVGVMLIGIGLFKKLVIADNLALLADPVFTKAAMGAPINPLSGWIGVFSYYSQLYFDFSGYSDMALGIARLFGIRFPINFFSPLKAVGIVDFYRRWHMTLTRVISRFLYTPLSLIGTRWAMARRLPKFPLRMLSLWLPLLVNFEVIGLWHGASATFVAFGLIHGLWYIAETQVRGAKAWKSWRKRTPDGVRTLLGRMIFLIPMSLTFALFRSEDLAAAWHLLSQITAGGLEVPQIVSPKRAVVMLAAAFSIIYLAPNSIELMARWRPGLMTFDHPLNGLRWNWLRWRPDWRWALLWTGLVVSSLYFVSRQPPFLYQGF